jgi:RHS repeat-associated protein
MNYATSSSTRGGAAYLGKDILGSIRSVSNSQAGLEDRYEYDAFGKPYKGDLENGMSLGYTGKPYDTATGMYNYGYRDYKPENARFTTLDPVRDGANWFAYVNNDPVNWVDIDGLKGTFANGQEIISQSGTLIDGTKYSITIVSMGNEKFDSYFRSGSDGDEIQHGTMVTTATYKNSDGTTDTYTQTTPVGGLAYNYGSGGGSPTPNGVTVNDIITVTATVTLTDTKETVAANFAVAPGKGD